MSGRNQKKADEPHLQRRETPGQPPVDVSVDHNEGATSHIVSQGESFNKVGDGSEEQDRPMEHAINNAHPRCLEQVLATSGVRLFHRAALFL